MLSGRAVLCVSKMMGGVPPVSTVRNSDTLTGLSIFSTVSCEESHDSPALGRGC